MIDGIPKIGSKIKNYGLDDVHTVINVRPYDGKYPKYFSCFITITSRITKSGIIEMAWEHGKHPFWRYEED